ncbi:MAG: NAD(P)-dependent oxidoreductase [Evtepia gabavorous]
MKSIGWIGVGIMGKPMVRNLQKAGYTLHIYARNREKVADVIQEGAIFHDTIGDCAQGRDAVITMVGFPKDVEEVYFAPGNILDRADPGTYLIDMTTTSPALAQRIFQQGRQRGLRVLDAPVTGGDIGARAGTLSILVGGEAADYQACRPLLAAMGTNLSHQGPAGCGQHAKLANQIMIAGTLSGLCEGLRYAQAKGLDAAENSWGRWPRGRRGASRWTLWGKNSRRRPCPGFFLKHFVKDMTLALGSPGTAACPWRCWGRCWKTAGIWRNGAGGPGNPGPYGSLPSGGVTGLLRRREDGEKGGGPHGAAAGV